MKLDDLKKLVEEMELNNAFDSLEAGRCEVCCGGNNGGNLGC